MADAVVPEAEGGQADAIEPLRELLADGAVHHLVGCGRVREQEGQAEGGKLGQHGRGGALAVDRHVERAGPERGQHGGVVAELGRARDPHLNAAVAALAQQRGHAVGRDAARVAGRCAVAEGQAHLGTLGAQDGRGRKGARHAEQDRPARCTNRHHRFLPESDRPILGPVGYSWRLIVLAMAAAEMP